MSVSILIKTNENESVHSQAMQESVFKAKLLCVIDFKKMAQQNHSEEDLTVHFVGISQAQLFPKTFKFSSYPLPLLSQILLRTPKTAQPRLESISATTPKMPCSNEDESLHCGIPGARLHNMSCGDHQNRGMDHTELRHYCPDWPAFQ